MSDVYEKDHKHSRRKLLYGLIGVAGIAGGGASFAATGDGGGGSTNNTTDSTTTQESQANLQIASANSYLDGNNLEATATIENTGDSAGSGTVELVVNSQVKDSTLVDVGAGSQQNVAMDHQVGSTGELSVEVQIGSSSETQTVTVEDPQLTILNVTLPGGEYNEGAEEQISVDVENTGNVETTDEPVDLDVDGTNGRRDESETLVTLNAGGQTTVSLSWTPAEGDKSLVIGTPSGEETRAVDVKIPGEFKFNALIIRGGMNQGEDATVGYEVENIGDYETTEEIDFKITGQNTEYFSKTENLKLTPGEIQESTFTWGIDENGQMTLTASAKSSTITQKKNALVSQSMFGGNVGFSTRERAKGKEDEISQDASIYVR